MSLIEDGSAGAAAGRAGRPGGRALGLAGRLGTWLAALMFPPVCPACAAETAGPGLCGACFAATRFLTGPACATCALPEPALAAPDPDWRCARCRAEPPPLDAMRAVAAYGGPVRRLLLGLKHADRLDHVPLLADWLAACAGDDLRAAGAIVPVPLHWRRRLARRFNQSAELARLAARRAGNPGAFDPGALRRIRDTPSQRDRDTGARRANVAGAFRARPGALAGRHVLLVDDVATTGATLAEAARVCRAAGARRVTAAVIALVVRDHPPYLPGAGDAAHAEAPEHEDA